MNNVNKRPVAISWFVSLVIRHVTVCENVLQKTDIKNIQIFRSTARRICVLQLGFSAI